MNKVDDMQKQELKEKAENKPKKLTMFICGENGLSSLEDLPESDRKKIEEIINNWSK
jgi:hypothetical protein